MWADSSGGEHRPYKPGVRGSNPLPPILLFKFSKIFKLFEAS